MGKQDGKIRNVALIAHGGAGKTSLVEALAFITGATGRLGKVEAGNTVADFDPEEVKRHISLSTAVVPCTWREHKVNLLDTPGYFDFVGEVMSALAVVEGALIVVCAASGVEVGTEKSWDYAATRELPRVFFINKMDRENADFTKTLGALRERFGKNVVPLTLPLGAAESFSGIVDLVRNQAYLYQDGKAVPTEIPVEMAEAVATARDELAEAAAAADDELLAKYLDGESLTDEEIREGLAIGTAQRQVFPVLCGSAFKLAGLDLLLDTLLAVIPSPLALPPLVGKGMKGEEEKRSREENGPLVARVFKTMADPYVGKLSLFRVYAGSLRSDSQVWNATRQQEERLGQLFFLRGKEQQPVTAIEAGDIGAVAKLQHSLTGDTLCEKAHAFVLPPLTFPEPTLSLAVEPKAKGDEEKISMGLTRLAEEDLTFRVEHNHETGQTLISGLGELHLEVIASRLQKKFGVGVTLTDPKVPYRETIRGTAKAEGKHKKQTGGHGQYGHVWLELEPLPGGGFEFVDKIFGGAVPKQYIPAVEKGVRETMAAGVLAGYPVMDLRVTLYDGSFHPVDSSEMAFKIAASLAFKKGFMDAKPILLEPVMNIEVVVPESFMGDVMGDLNKRRGRILGMDPRGDLQVIRAQAPLAEMFKYAIDLRSMTQGRGSFKMSFAQYEEVPAPLAEKIIAARSGEKGAS